MQAITHKPCAAPVAAMARPTAGARAGAFRAAQPSIARPSFAKALAPQKAARVERVALVCKAASGEDKVRALPSARISPQPALGATAGTNAHGCSPHKRPRRRRGRAAAESAPRAARPPIACGLLGHSPDRSSRPWDARRWW